MKASLGIKELTFILELSEIIEKKYLSEKKVLYQLLERTVSFWPYEQSVCASICIKDQQYCSANYDISQSFQWAYARDLLINTQKIGWFEVAYLDPPEGRELFSEQTKAFIAIITCKITNFIEQKWTEKLLTNYHDELERIMDEQNHTLVRLNDELKCEVDERRQLEQKLKISHQRHKVAMQAGGVGTWEWNIDNDELYLDPSIKAMLGYDIFEIKNNITEWFKLIHPDDVKMVKNKTNAFIKGEISAYEIEYRMLGKDGDIHWFCCRGTLIKDADSKASILLGTLTDMTRRKDLEETWRRFEFIINASMELITMIDRDYIHITANEAYCRAFGKTRSTIEGKNVRMVWGSEIFKVLKQKLAQCFSGEINDPFWEFTGRDQRFYRMTFNAYLDTQKQVTHAVIVTHDITSKKDSEDALRNSEERFRATFEQAAVGMGLIQRNYHIIKLNRCFCEILGYSGDDLQGISIFDLIFQKDLDAPEYQKLVSGEINSFSMEARYIRKDRSIVWGNTTATLVRNARDEPKYFIILFEDITKLKTTEQTKRNLETQLQHSQKIQAIGTLAGGIAHDFNNILTPIMVNTEMSLMDVPQEGHLHDQINAILKAARRAKDLVKQILTFSRQNEIEGEPLEVQLIIKEVLKLMSATLPSNIEIHPLYYPLIGSGYVKVDPTKIHQILMNLCTNAAHAMSKGGVLEVSLSDTYLDQRSDTSLAELNQGHYIILKVTDTGHGMTSHIMERIFDPYFTTKVKDEGTGLGLAVLHGIVTGYGGTIRVSSKPGQGSVFTIFLPEIQKSEHGKCAQMQAAIPKGKEKILFVDDDAAVLESVPKMLQRLGYQVLAAQDPQEALHRFKAEYEDFDLIITDYGMPKMNGVMFSRQALSICPGIPIILCSGFADKISTPEIKAAGIVEFIMKPVVMSEIALSIRRAIEFKKNHDPKM